MFDELDLMLPEEVFDGPMQMALDEVLLRSTDRPLVRIYQWEVPCVSFGYFQKHAEVRELHPGMPLVRRWTGGGMVSHGSDLTFSLMIPQGSGAATMAPAFFYRELHGRLATWLSGLLSSEVHLAGEEEVRSGESCFTAPARDDLLMRGRKILGGAQRRSGGALLYQGSIQGAGEQGSGSVAREGLASALASSVTSRVLPLSARNQSEALARGRYRTEEWNQRR